MAESTAVAERRATVADRDSDLARSAAGGDAGAFDELYRRHADAAWRVAYAVTGKADDAADAVAEAFTRVFTAMSAGKLAELEAFRPYLLATTRNAGIDVLRRAGRVQPVGDGLAETAQTSGTGPSEHLIAGVDAALVAAAFRSLPERWRSVLWLTEVEGMAPAEAAGLLGVSANGAAQLAVRARAGLRQRFLQAHLRKDVSAECRYTVDRLGAYVGGGLAARDIAKVDQHLAACPACQARQADLEELSSSLRKVSAALPLTLAGVVWSRWRRVSDGRVARPRAGFPVGAQRGLLGASLGILALGIIGVSVVGQPAIGSVGHSRAAQPVPVGQNPMIVQEAAAAAAPAALPLRLALPASSGFTGGGGSATGAGTRSGAGGAGGSGGPASPGTGAAPGSQTSPGGSGTGPASPLPSLPPPSLPLPGVSPSGGSPTVQLGGQINLSPAPASGAVSAGTAANGVALNTPAGSQSVAVSGSAPTATNPSTTGSPSVSATVTSPAGSQSVGTPSSSGSSSGSGAVAGTVSGATSSLP